MLDSELDGDLNFLQNGEDKAFSYLTRQVPKSWRISNGSFQTNARANIKAKLFDCLASKEYFIQLDVVEYKKPIDKPRFDLILGSNTKRGLGIFLDFGTKEIRLDGISLPLRDINKRKTRAQVEESWSINNSIYQERAKKPQSTLEATKCIIQILDTKYEKADLRTITENCKQLSDPEQ